MSNLTDLVPSIDLCKKIPAGEFEESFFVLVRDSFNQYFAVRNDVCADYPGYIYPAPTLQEIMLEIDNAGGWCPTAYRLHDQWKVDYQIDNENGLNGISEHADTDNPATAALKLWLKLKGIEYEQKQG